MSRPGIILCFYSFIQRLGDRAHTLFADLAGLSVVAVKPVYFVLNVRQLRVNASAAAGRNRRYDHPAV